MRVAVPAWNDRVSPVFDVATRVLVFTVEGGAVTERSWHRLDGARRNLAMSAIGVDVLLCSAISRPLESALRAVGIEVVSEVCGPVDDVLRAYLKGGLAAGRLLTPAHARRLHGDASTAPACGEDARETGGGREAPADGAEPDRAEDRWAGCDPRDAGRAGKTGGC